jgi:hypothetical protein
VDVSQRLGFQIACVRQNHRNLPIREVEALLPKSEPRIEEAFRLRDA